MKQDGDGVRAPRPKGGGAGGTEQLLTDGTGRPSGQNRLTRPPHTEGKRIGPLPPRQSPSDVSKPPRQAGPPRLRRGPSTERGTWASGPSFSEILCLKSLW